MRTITLTFYDEIRTGDAEGVLAQLSADPTAAVEVRINSPGGSVTEGLAIFNALKPRASTVYIDGVAASIASLIAMAGAHIIVAENALLMVHFPWTGTEGNADALRKTADLLDKYGDAMLGAYARTGLNRARLSKLLEAETWMTAPEAVALGFADEIAEPLRYAAHSPECFAGYKHPPKELTMKTNTTAAAAASSDTSTSGATAAPATTQPATSAAASTASTDAVAMAALRARNSEIMTISEPYANRSAIRESMIAALADPSITVDGYRAKVLALLGRDSTPVAGSRMAIEASDHAAPDFVAAVGDALAIRAGISVPKPHPGARDVQGMTLGEIMRVCVSRNGRTLDIGAPSRKSTVKAAMSTSDFPAILENSLGKALRAGFEAEPSTFTAWTHKITVPDFKPQSRVLLGSGPDLLPVPEGAEYKAGSMDDDKSVPYSVGKFGRMVQLTWEAMINDDLGAFLRMTQALGQAAARAEADTIYASFAENSGAGPTMQDNVVLFHATHANLATSAAAITADSLGAARVLLRRQKALGGGALNLTPRYLLVAPEQEQAAETLLAASSRQLSQGASNTLVPTWLAQLELVVEARLTDDAFFLLTAPETVDTLERAWLEADNGPVVEEQDGFAVDSRQYKVRHVFGARWLDWRGAVKVPLSN